MIETYLVNTDNFATIKWQKKEGLQVETRNVEKECTHESTLNEYLHDQTNIGARTWNMEQESKK